LCSEDEVGEFVRSVPEFERMPVRSGIRRVKHGFSIPDEGEHRRLLGRIHDPLKPWKLSPMDLESRWRWELDTKAREAMAEHTRIPEAPWWVVQAVDAWRLCPNRIDHPLSRMPHCAIATSRTSNCPSKSRIPTCGTGSRSRTTQIG